MLFEFIECHGNRPGCFQPQSGGAPPHDWQLARSLGCLHGCKVSVEQLAILSKQAAYQFGAGLGQAWSSSGFRVFCFVIVLRYVYDFIRLDWANPIGN